MLSFSVRKEIIENDNSLVDISLSKIGENEFSSDFIANLQTRIIILLLFRNAKITGKWKERSVYFFSRHNIPKLTCLTAKFQDDPIDILRETAWRSNFCLVLSKSFLC